MHAAPRLDLDTLVLKHGSHASAKKGLCLMEAVAYFANEPHSDSPACACRVLTSYGIRMNDRFSDDERQLLKPLIPLLVGTRATPEVEKRRAYLLVDRAIRVIVPLALDARLPVYAANLRALPEVKDVVSANVAAAACREAREAARELRRTAAADDDDAAAAYAAAYAADARKPLVAEAIKSLELAIAIV